MTNPTTQDSVFTEFINSEKHYLNNNIEPNTFLDFNLQESTYFDQEEKEKDNFILDCPLFEEPNVQTAFSTPHQEFYNHSSFWTSYSSNSASIDENIVLIKSGEPTIKSNSP